MNRSLNVFLGLSICLVLFGGMWFLSRVDRDNEGWRPSDMYSQVSTGQAGTSSFTNATLGTSSSNDGVLLSMRSRSFSSRVHTPVSSYAPVGANFGSQSSAVGSASYSAQGGGLYTTSSAEVRSFGGGGNVSAGSAGGFRASAQGSIAQAAGVSSSLSVGGASYTPVLSTSSSVSNDDMLAMAQASNVASASGYAALGYTTATYGTATYGSTANRISGRKNAGPTGMSWVEWIEYWYTANGWMLDDTDSYGLDVYKLRSAYDAYIAKWNGQIGGPSLPTWDQWLAWFMSNGGSHTSGNENTFYFVPVGNYLPLLLLALAYAGYIAIRRRNKSLEKTLK